MHFQSARHYVEFMAAHYGPMLKALEAVGDARREELADVEGIAERYDRGGAGALELECDWLSIVADR